MTDFCHTIYKRNSARKNNAFHFNYSMEHGRVKTSSPIENEMVRFHDNLRDVLGFKRKIIEGENAETISGMGQSKKKMTCN